MSLVSISQPGFTASVSKNESFQAAWADQMVISGDYAFLADGDLKIYYINDSKVTEPDVIEIDDAVEVVISGTNAIVSVSGEDGMSIEIVDVSDYIEDGSETDDSESATCDEDTYLGSYDLEEGIITLPGVEIDGEIFTLIFEQRGNSNNRQLMITGDAGEDDDDDVDDDDDGDDEEEEEDDDDGEEEVEGGEE